MRKFLIAAAIVAAPTPAFAANDATGIDGFVSAAVGYQGNGNNFNAPSDKGVTYELRGTAEVPLSNVLGVQADLSYSRDLANFTAPFEVATKSTGITTHLFYRKPEKFLVGVIGQVDFNATSASFFRGTSLDSKQYFIGGEAQAYLNKVTLSGQVAYRNDDFDVFGGSLDGVIATAQAKYFVQDNWSLALNGQYSHISAGSNGGLGMKQWRIGLGTERRLSSVPASFFASANYGSDNFDSFGEKLHDARFQVGIRINFGSGSLKARDNAGASLEQFKVSSSALLFPT